MQGVASYGGMQDVAAAAACSKGRVPNSRCGGSCPVSVKSFGDGDFGSCAIISLCNLLPGVVSRLGGV